ncbi:MAG: thiamine phosphate synthase [Betaproteobacteria bacterium]|nr:thiamine phosphate synthase [Betaproteobacteria bacterium]
MRRAELRGLYAITPDWPDTHRLLAVTEAILDAGCRLLQYRHKRTSDCHRQEQALALRRLTRQHGALLLINDDVELARYSEADGVHLGAEDGSIEAARQRLGAEKILGVSCYQDSDLARKAAASGADYVAFGSFFPSLTKPQAHRAGLELLSADIGLPRCAIGGITLENAPPLVAAGADMLAIITALYDAPDPARAARQFIQIIEEHA